jgi:hypothetical protein
MGWNGSQEDRSISERHGGSSCNISGTGMKQEKQTEVVAVRWAKFDHRPDDGGSKDL